MVWSIALFALSHTGLCGQALGQSLTRGLIDSVSRDNLGRHIKTLEAAGGHYSRVNFTPGNDSGAAYIRRAFEALPHLSSVQLDTFYINSAVPPLKSKPLVNVIGTLRGRRDPSRVFVVGAHFDCSASRMGTQVWNEQWSTIRAPGADDNATGVAAILELARVLSDTSSGFSNDYTTRFVAFGAEESGPAYAGSHHGSAHYAQVVKSGLEDIIGMVSIDMIGYNYRYYFQSIVSDPSSTWLGEVFVAANDSNSIGLTTSRTPFPYATYSDHASFWDEGYPAVCLIENAPPWTSTAYYLANQYYHTSGDSLRTLNLELVRKVTQMTLAAIVSLNTRVTSAPLGQQGVPSTCELYQNYPNPFNPTTTIRFRAGHAEYVTLKVYDLLGRQITVLWDGNVSPGIYAFRWDATGFPAGVYFAKLTAGPLVASRKLLLLR